MRGLKNKNVLITGGSSGIGKATVRRFLEEESRVYFCGVEQDLISQTIVDFESLGMIEGSICDVSQEAEVEALVEIAEKKLGGIDILINNAGIAWQEAFLDIKPENWDRILSVNLRGIFLVAQAVTRIMVARGKGGVIVNMSSTNGLVGEEMYAHYGASKGGVLMLTKTMAVELGKYGIRVNALCPGYILTPLAESIYSSDSIQAYANEKIPLKRVGEPDEVAAAYAFLASDDASFIHGEGLVIDGGQLAY
jgi:3-oxoacyl-[acyl-carrier protein] reductase